MTRKILPSLAAALAGLTFTLAWGQAWADHGSEHSNRIARKPMAAESSTGMSKQEFMAQVERAWDRQQQAASAGDGRLSADQVQAVRRALSEPDAR